MIWYLRSFEQDNKRTKALNFPYRKKKSDAQHNWFNVFQNIFSFNQKQSEFRNHTQTSKHSQNQNLRSALTYGWLVRYKQYTPTRNAYSGLAIVALGWPLIKGAIPWQGRAGLAGARSCGCSRMRAQQPGTQPCRGSAKVHSLQEQRGRR